MPNKIRKRVIVDARTIRRRRRAIGLGVIGFGTVGTGTIRVLVEHREDIERRLGCKLELNSICSRRIHKRDLSWIGEPVAITNDWRKVVADPSVDIVVELVGDLSAARGIAQATLDAGKHLVTANKQLVAEHGVELAERSAEAGVSLGIEACVAGGTPLLHAVREGLAGEQFTAVYGILNGTTNYILTEMERRGCSFQQALQEAQQRGYAEPDPTFDVEGYDAQYKIAILAMICFGQAVRSSQIPVQGIRQLDCMDFTYAHRLNHTIRLIAGARRHRGDNLEIFVRPMVIPLTSPLAGVTGATNAILLVGNKGGMTTITGRGAGGEPTGVAVLSDVVGIARAILAGSAGTSPLGYTTWRPARIVPPGKSRFGTFLRFVIKDRPGILAKISAILARYRINIDSVLQEPGLPKAHLPFVMTLEPTREEVITQAVNDISRLPHFAELPLMMPFAGLP